MTVTGQQHRGPEGYEAGPDHYNPRHDLPPIAPAGAATLRLAPPTAA